MATDKPGMTGRPVTYLAIGDEVEVSGNRFILVNVKWRLEKPPMLEFKTPIELMKENS